MRDLLLVVPKDIGVTIILVSHDLEEPIFLADRLLMLTRWSSMVADDVEVTLP